MCCAVLCRGLLQGGVLFTMAPWRNPMSVKRVWCLFEALTALSLGREINLLTDPFDSMAKVDTLLPLFLKVGQAVGGSWGPRAGREEGAGAYGKGRDGAGFAHGAVCRGACVPPMPA